MIKKSIGTYRAVVTAGVIAMLFPAGAGATPVTAGLVVKLDGSTMSTVPDTITQEVQVTSWADRSGLGNDAVHTGGDHVPIIAYGVTPAGGNAVKFDGSSTQYLEVAATESLESTELSWYFVFRPGALDQGRILNSAYGDFNPDPSQTNLSYAGWGSMPANNARLRAQVRTTTAGFAAAEVTGIINTNQFFIGGGRWAPLEGTGEVEVVAINQAGQREAALETGANGVPQDHIFTWIGSGAGHTSGTPASPYTGEIAEILIFNRKLSDTEQTELETYLADRHFLGLDAVLPDSTGLVLWLDASDLSPSEPVEESITRVTQWTDLSGNSHHAKSSLVDHEFPRLAEGVTATAGDAVRFNGETEFLEIEGHPAFDGPARSWYVVFRPDAFNNSRLINAAYVDVDPGPDFGTNYATWGSIVAGSGRYRTQGRTADSGFVAAQVSDIVTAEDFVIGGSMWDSTTGELTAIAVDKTGRREIGVEGGADALPTGNIFTRIGAGSGLSSSNATARYTGDIAEILVYDRLLTSEEQQSVELYLREKHFGPVGEPAGFTAWRYDNFGWPEAEYAEVSGPMVDLYNDGVVNLLRYAFGLSADGPAPRDVLPATAVLEDDGVVLTFTRLKDAFDLSYVVEVTEDLETWKEGPDYTEILDTEDFGETERVTVWAKTLPGESGRGFMRLRVELID